VGHLCLLMEEALGFVEAEGCAVEGFEIVEVGIP